MFDATTTFIAVKHSHPLLYPDLSGCDKIMATDFTNAKQDVLPFVKDEQSVALWSQEFFIHLLDNLKTR